MSLSLRSSLYLNKILSARKLPIALSASKLLSNDGNIGTITRSLSFISNSKLYRPLATVSSKALLSNKCSCGLHTKGDQELAAFLVEEIENERKAQGSDNLLKLEGFECTLNGSDVTLTKRHNNEVITIKSNVNNSVDAEESVADPNEGKEQQEAEMKAKPEFTVEIKKGNKTLCFICTYSQAMPDEEEAESYSDAFQISEVSLYEGEAEDYTYCVSGDIMDGYLYDLLMNYLEERGISSDFSDKMVAFFTAYEHKLYINLLQGLKNFVEK